MRVLIIGCGYVGTPLATRLQALGHEVWGLRRSDGPHLDLLEVGVTPLVGDITQAESIATSLHGLTFDAIVNATSSRGGGEEGYEQLYLRGTQRVLEHFKSTPPQCYVHLSSTSVYGQTSGEVVTEDSPALPTNATSRVLVATEQWLLDSVHDPRTRVVILRSAGIYGPERRHLFLKFIRGEATLTGDGDRWLNMIHREDVVSSIIGALGDQEQKCSGILNLADDAPVQERTFYAWLATELNRPMPPSIDPSTRVKKRGDTNKRVMNGKLKEICLPILQFPSFREGYRAEIQRLGLSGSCHP